MDMMSLMLSSVDFSGMGMFLFLHAIIILITPVCLIAGIAKFKHDSGKVSLYVGIGLSLYLVKLFCID